MSRTYGACCSQHLEVEGVVVGEQDDGVGLGELLVGELDALDVRGDVLAHVRIGGAHSAPSATSRLRDEDRRRLAASPVLLLVREARAAGCGCR